MLSLVAIVDLTLVGWLQVVSFPLTIPSTKPTHVESGQPRALTALAELAQLIVAHSSWGQLEQSPKCEHHRQLASLAAKHLHEVARRASDTRWRSITHSAVILSTMDPFRRRRRSWMGINDVIMMISSLVMDSQSWSVMVGRLNWTPRQRGLLGLGVEWKMSGRISALITPVATSARICARRMELGVGAVS
jgi:hypothetical protein